MRKEKSGSVCFYCHSPLNPGVSFCPLCGMEQPSRYGDEPRHSKNGSSGLCVYCSARLEPGSNICPECGMEQPARRKKKKKKGGGCGLFFAVLFMAAVAATVFYGLPWLKQKYATPNVTAVNILPAGPESSDAPGETASVSDSSSGQGVSEESQSTGAPSEPPEESSAAVSEDADSPVQSETKTAPEVSVESTGISFDLLGKPIVKSAEDLEALFDWMISSFTLSADLSISSALDESTLNRVADLYAFPHIHWTTVVNRVTQITVTLYTGEKIWYAAQNGKTDLLDAAEVEMYRTALGIVTKKTGTLSSDFDKELALHDYIVNNCSYEVNAGLETDTCAGFFKHGKAQCSGYADTFALLCRLAGVECVIVSGTSKEENASHAWNLVKLDQKWYAVDCTYDDPTGGSEGHSFFNVPPTCLSEKRTMDSKAPEAGSYATDWDTNYWYIHYGYYAKNRDGAVEVLRNQLGAGKAYLMLGKKLDLGDLTDKVLRNTQYKGWSYTSREIGGGVWVYEAEFTE